jgi:hypothetical protein
LFKHSRIAAKNESKTPKTRFVIDHTEQSILRARASRAAPQSMLPFDSAQVAPSNFPSKFVFRRREKKKKSITALAPRRLGLLGGKPL